jgi:hypothetical protein
MEQVNQGGVYFSWKVGPQKKEKKTAINLQLIKKSDKLLSISDL